MSRIGKKVISVPSNVRLSFEENKVKVNGPKGEQVFEIPQGIQYTFEESQLNFSRSSDDKKTRALHGLTRALAFNAVEGVSTGFRKVLKIEGVGFRAEMKGSRLQMALGFSHPILIVPPTGIEFTVPNPTTVEIAGFDKQLLGEVASKIRELRPPEPYKGKGVRYENETVRRKAGKTSAK